MQYSVSWKVDTSELDRIAKQLDVKADQVIRVLGVKAEVRAAGLAPWDTGSLVNSMTSEFVGNQAARVGPKAGAVNAETGAPVVEYAIYQELGFHHWKSGQFIQNAFLTPAIESLATEFASPTTWMPLFT